MTNETTVTLKGWVLRDPDTGDWQRDAIGWQDAPLVFRTKARAINHLRGGVPVRVEGTIREVGK